jgi:hypothetical protein
MRPCPFDFQDRPPTSKISKTSLQTTLNVTFQHGDGDITCAPPIGIDMNRSKSTEHINPLSATLRVGHIVVQCNLMGSGEASSNDLVMLYVSCAKGTRNVRSPIPEIPFAAI